MTTFDSTFTTILFYLLTDARVKCQIIILASYIHYYYILSKLANMSISPMKKALFYEFKCMQ